jgi:hypothetical protein
MNRTPSLLAERLKSEAWETVEDFRHWREDGHVSGSLVFKGVAWGFVAVAGGMSVLASVIVAYSLGAERALASEATPLTGLLLLSLAAAVGVLIMVLAAKRMSALDDQIRARRAPCAHRAAKSQASSQ